MSLHVHYTFFLSFSAELELQQGMINSRFNGESEQNANFSFFLDIYPVPMTTAPKAQFRRRASAVPNLIAIRFECSTAEALLCFRRCARDVPNSWFSEAP